MENAGTAPAPGAPAALSSLSLSSWSGNEPDPHLILRNMEESQMLRQAQCREPRAPTSAPRSLGGTLSSSHTPFGPQAVRNAWLSVLCGLSRYGNALALRHQQSAESHVGLCPNSIFLRRYPGPALSTAQYREKSRPKQAASFALRVSQIVHIDEASWRPAAAGTWRADLSYETHVHHIGSEGRHALAKGRRKEATSMLNGDLSTGSPDEHASPCCHDVQYDAHQIGPTSNCAYCGSSRYSFS